MSFFGNLNNEGLEQAQDRLGGFSPLESDIYTGTIEYAFAGQSDKGSKFVELSVDFGGTKYRERVYVTNKKGENFFLNKNDQTKKVPLPGFTTIDDICMVTSEKPLHQQTIEDKVLKLYDYDAKGEIPKTVPVLTELTGKTVSLGILKQLVNKSESDGNGGYVPTAETREENVIDKVFHTPTMLTMVEARNGLEAGAFHESWLKRNKGVTKDNRKIKDGATAQGGQSGRPGAGAPPQAGSTQNRGTSLFAKNG